MNLHYVILKDDFMRAGEASSNLKKKLKQLGISSGVIQKVAIAMYEAEMNMVIHANGGVIDIDIEPQRIYIKLEDTGPGIPDIDLAMREGYSTASDQVRDLGFGAGMGLPNMKKNADMLRIASEVGKGTTVEIEVML